MRASSITVLVAFLSLTVSCAHKPQIDEGAEKKQAKIEKKIEKKQADNKAYTCLVGKDKRLVTLDKKEKRCEVKYTKFGDAKNPLLLSVRSGAAISMPGMMDTGT